MTFIVRDQENLENKTQLAQVCFPVWSGSHGWCKVKQVDTKMDYARGTDWGFCSHKCSEIKSDKAEEVKVRPDL